MNELQTSIFDPQYSREARRDGFRVSMKNHVPEAERVLRELVSSSTPLTAPELSTLTRIRVTSVHRCLRRLIDVKDQVECLGKIDGPSGAKNSIYWAK